MQARHLLWVPFGGTTPECAGEQGETYIQPLVLGQPVAQNLASDITLGAGVPSVQLVLD